MMIRRTATAAMLAAIALTLTACGGEEDPEALPAAPSSSTAGTPTAPPPTASAAPAWQAKYTSAQIQAYEAALQRWDSYQQRSEPVWAAGKATPEAERLFQKYNGNSAEIDLLKSYEAVDVQIKGLGTVLSSKPTEIKLTGTAGTISIRQCVDFSSRTGTQAGKVIQPVTDKPQLRQINMYLGGTPAQWFIANIVRGEGKSPC